MAVDPKQVVDFVARQRAVDDAAAVTYIATELRLDPIEHSEVTDANILDYFSSKIKAAPDAYRVWQTIYPEVSSAPPPAPAQQQPVVVVEAPAPPPAQPPPQQQEPEDVKPRSTPPVLPVERTVRRQPLWTQAIEPRRLDAPYMTARGIMPANVPADKTYTLVNPVWGNDIRSMQCVDQSQLPGQFIVTRDRLNELKQVPQLVFPNNGPNPFPGGSILRSQVRWDTVTSNPADIQRFLCTQPCAEQNSSIYNPKWVEHSISAARKLKPTSKHPAKSSDIHPAATASRVNGRQARAERHHIAVERAKDLRAIAASSRTEY